MKQKLWILPLVLLIAGIVFGPRPPRPSFKLRHLVLPADLQSWAQEDKRVDGLRPDTERHFIWAGKPNEETSFGISYIHGFSASPHEISPVVENVAQALKANVFFQRLTGHGLDGAALAKVTSSDYLRDGLEAIEVAHRIGKKSVVIGTGTGATIAAWLVTRGVPIDVLILISPNFGGSFKATSVLAWPWGFQIGTRLIGKEFSFNPINASHSKYWTLNYPLESLLPVTGLFADVSTSDMAKIEVPTLIMVSPTDENIDPSGILRYFAEVEIPNKKLIRVPAGSPHVIAGDANAPQNNAFVIEEITNFIKSSRKP